MGMPSMTGFCPWLFHSSALNLEQDLSQLLNYSCILQFNADISLCDRKANMALCAIMHVVGNAFNNSHGAVPQQPESILESHRGRY